MNGDSMGLFSRMAEATEQKTIAALEEALGRLTSLAKGRGRFLCHLAAEAHAGVWVGEPAGSVIGVYRCRGHFWGVELSPEDRELLRRDGDISHRQANAVIQGGDYRVVDLGSMSLGVDSLALALAAHLKTEPQSFSKLVKDLNEVLSEADIAVHQVTATESSEPIDAFRVEAPGLEPLTLFIRDGRWERALDESGDTEARDLGTFSPDISDWMLLVSQQLLRRAAHESKLLPWLKEIVGLLDHVTATANAHWHRDKARAALAEHAPIVARIRSL